MADEYATPKGLDGGGEIPAQPSMAPANRPTHSAKGSTSSFSMSNSTGEKHSYKVDPSFMDKAVEVLSHNGYELSRINAQRAKLSGSSNE